MAAFRYPVILFILLLPGFLASPAAAQAPVWNNVSGRTGFSLISGLSDGTLFGLYGNTLYRSFDEGDTWENFLRPGGPVIEFTTGGDVAAIVIFNAEAFSSRQLFISTDRGDSWERIYAERLFPVPPSHQNIMVADWGEIFSLEYSGPKVTLQRYTRSRWEQVGEPSTIYAGAFSNPFTVSDVDGAGTFYIGTTYDGIHSTRDSGQTWTRALPYRSISAIELSPNGTAYTACWPNQRTNGGVFRSDDGGLTWQLIGLTDVGVTDLAIDGAGNLFAVSASGIFRYGGGVTWMSLGPFDFVYDILQFTLSGKYIATAPGYGMLISSDGGEHWKTDGVRMQDIYSVCGTADGSLLAGTLGEGVFRSTNGGGLWEQFHDPPIPEYFYALYTAGSRVFAGTESGLFRSDDDGRSWNFLTADLNILQASMPVYSVAIRPDGPIFIGTGSGVYRSTDDGRSWTESGLQNSRVLSLGVGPERKVYAATSDEGVFASQDDGNSWTGRGLVRPDVQTIAVSEAGHLAVGVYGAVFHSTDEGNTWSDRVFAQAHVYSLLYSGNHQIFAGTAAGMFMSDDGGDVWSPAGLDGDFVVTLAYNRDHNMLAGTFKGGVYLTAQIITPVREPQGVPVVARLYQNYPNPFNPRTTIAYDVPRTSEVSVSVYDVIGREVDVLFSGRLPGGRYNTVWDAGQRPSGVYYCRVRITPEGEDPASGNDGTSVNEVRKMILLR